MVDLRYFSKKPVSSSAKGNITNIKSGGNAYSLSKWCEEFGHEKLMKDAIDRIDDECSTHSSNTVTESTLLLTAVIDESIHLDGFFIILLIDPAAV